MLHCWKCPEGVEVIITWKLKLMTGTEHRYWNIMD